LEGAVLRASIWSHGIGCLAGYLVVLGSGCNIQEPTPEAGPGFAIPDAGAPDSGWTRLDVLAGQVGVVGSEDGIGPGARLDNPGGVAATAAYLYFADTGNQVLRRIALDAGSVTTIAGTPGVAGPLDGVGPAAAFSQPEGLAIDEKGILYLADSANDAIRRIDPTTATVTTLAGTLGVAGSADGLGSAAGFRSPHGLAYDPLGYLWVADTGNDTIRQITLTTKAVVTIAGTPGARGSSDGTGPTALFNAPWGIAPDGSGGAYVTDTGNETLRWVNSTGTVSTLAGAVGQPGSVDGVATNAQFIQPAGLVSDGNGNLYIADTGNGAIRQVVIGSTTVTTPVGILGEPGLAIGPLPAGLAAPEYLAFGSGGQLFVSDDDVIVVVH
jgi:streptogramin lyase